VQRIDVARRGRAHGVDGIRRRFVTAAAGGQREQDDTDPSHAGAHLRRVSRDRTLTS
jgi:hypothetical protein